MTATAKSLIVPAIALGLGAACVAVTLAQERERSRQALGSGAGRGSLLGLVGLEQVQKEMNLSKEQTTKVQEVVKELRAEMQEQYATLPEFEDRDQERAKITELRNEFDQKVAQQLGDLVEREQMIRLYQIRMQVRAVVDSLANRYVSIRLELTDDQKNKLDKIIKSLRAKQSEAYATIRDANDERRSAALQKLRKIRADADSEALALLTAEQKAAYEAMKGEKIELQSTID